MFFTFAEKNYVILQTKDIISVDKHFSKILIELQFILEIDYAYHGKTDFKNMYDETEILKLSDNQQKIFGKIEAGDLLFKKRQDRRQFQSQRFAKSA